MTNIHPFGVDFANTFMKFSHWNIALGFGFDIATIASIDSEYTRRQKNRKAGPVELLLTQLVSGICMASPPATGCSSLQLRDHLQLVSIANVCATTCPNDSEVLENVWLSDDARRFNLLNPGVSLG